MKGGNMGELLSDRNVLLAIIFIAAAVAVMLLAKIT